MQQHGYYIYYERNEDMQNYMVEHGKGKGTEEALSAADLRKNGSARQNPEISSPRKKSGQRKTDRWNHGGGHGYCCSGDDPDEPFYKPGGVKPVSGPVEGETVNIQVVEADTPEAAERETETLETDSEKTVSEVSNTMTTKHYTVRKGDTLANISLSLYDSRKYVDTICEINDIEDPDVIL